MITAALLSFGILLLAWILAPNGVRAGERPPAHPEEPRALELEAQGSY